MPNSKRVVGKSVRYRSSVPAISSASDRVHFQTPARLSVKLVSREELYAWRAKIVAVLLLVAIGIGLYEFFDSEWFFIDDVQVQGLNLVSRPEVGRASGALSYNTFFLEPSHVERAVSKMPEIKSAHAMIGIPNLVLIQVEERVPEIVWIKGTEAYWVDADGIAFRARSPRTDLPSVRDLDQTAVQPGKHVTAAALNALHALRAAWLQSPKNFEWSASDGLSAIDEHGWKIIFGDANDMDLKITKLFALVPRLAAQNAHVKFIDLGKGEPFYQ